MIVRWLCGTSAEVAVAAVSHPRDTHGGAGSASVVRASQCSLPPAVTEYRHNQGHTFPHRRALFVSVSRSGHFLPRKDERCLGTDP